MMKRQFIAILIICSLLFCQFPLKFSFAQQGPDNAADVYKTTEHEQANFQKINSPSHCFAKRHWAGLTALGLTGLKYAVDWNFYGIMDNGYFGVKAAKDGIGKIESPEVDKLIRVLHRMKKIGMLSKEGNQLLTDLHIARKEAFRPWVKAGKPVSLSGLHEIKDVELAQVRIPKSDWKIVNKFVYFGPWVAIAIFIVLDIIFNPIEANAYDGVMPLAIIEKYNPFPCRQAENLLHMMYAGLTQESKKQLLSIYNDEFFNANSIFDAEAQGEDITMERIYYPSYFLIKASIDQILESDYEMDRTVETKMLEQEFLKNQELFSYYKIIGQNICAAIGDATTVLAQN